MVMGRQAGLGRKTATRLGYCSAKSDERASLGSSRGGRCWFLGGCGRPVPDGLRGESVGARGAVRARGHLLDPWDRGCGSDLPGPADAQGDGDAPPTRPAAGKLTRPVANSDPSRISPKPTTAPTVNGSCSTTTPSRSATAGLKQVITVARTG